MEGRVGRVLLLARRPLVKMNPPQTCWSRRTGLPSGSVTTRMAGPDPDSSASVGGLDAGRLQPTLDLADIGEVGQRGAIRVPAGIEDARVALQHPLVQADDGGASAN